MYTIVKRDVTGGEFPLIPRNKTLPLTIPVKPELRWVPDKYPFLFLIPVYSGFYAPLFDRLNYKEKDLPIVPIRTGKYVLATNFITEWISLERNLKAILHAMADICTVPLPKYFEFWPFPQRYGYQTFHPSKEIIRTVAVRSRDAFLPLMAAITLFLIILNDRESKVPGFTWRDRVLSKTGIHHEWLSMLENSVVGDLRIPRCGGIIDIRQCQYKGLIPLLASAQLDMYIFWGKNPDPGDGRLKQWLVDRNLVPDHHQISYLSRLPVPHFQPSPSPPPPALHMPSPLLLPASSPPHPPRHLPSPLRVPSSSPPPVDPQTPSTTSVFPPVERYGQQRPGETWQNFFARRLEVNQRRLVHETARQRQSRLAKEEVAAKNLPPGRKGSNVFRWEEVKGFRIRRAVGYKFYNLWWTDYSRVQRKYDSFHDEWDVCTEFGDPEYPNSDDSEGDEEFMEFYNNGPKSNNGETPGGDASPQDEDNFLQPLSPGEYEADHHERNHLSKSLGGDTSPRNEDDPFQLLPPDEHEDDHNEGNYSSNADLRRIHDDQELPIPPSRPTEELTPDLICEGFTDTVYYRFGMSSVTAVEPSSYTVKWDLAAKALGNARWRDGATTCSFPSQNVQDDICAFLGHLSSSHNISSIPSQILDIRQPESDIWKNERRFRLRVESLDGILYYFIRPWAHLRPESAPMEIGLTSSVGLLEVFRRELGPELDSAAEFFIDRGIRFNTFIRSNFPPPQPSANPRYRGLGYRPRNYRPDALDYQAYVSTRNRFLRTSRCRAALMAGGLIARIAKDMVPYTDVFYGPSDAVFLEGMCLWDGKKSSPKYWDDKLTEHEMDIICGVYKVATGTHFSN